MATYTIVMDWDGGTYIHQVKGSSVHSAVLRWAKRFDVGPIAGMGTAALQQLNVELRSREPCPLEGVNSVWCYTPIVLGRLALLNVIRTDCGS